MTSLLSGWWGVSLSEEHSAHYTSWSRYVSALQHSVLQHSVLQHSALQHSAVRCGVVRGHCSRRLHASQSLAVVRVTIVHVLRASCLKACGVRLRRAPLFDACPSDDVARHQILLLLRPAAWQARGDRWVREVGECARRSTCRHARSMTLMADDVALQCHQRCFHSALNAGVIFRHAHTVIDDAITCSGMDVAHYLVGLGDEVTVIDPTAPWGRRESDSSYGRVTVHTGPPPCISAHPQVCA